MVVVVVMVVMLWNWKCELGILAIHVPEIGGQFGKLIRVVVDHTLIQSTHMQAYECKGAFRFGRLIYAADSKLRVRKKRLVYASTYLEVGAFVWYWSGTLEASVHERRMRNR